ncbi:hypothetical protein [Micrococcus sp. IITD107]|uniref:hypothetical protein n=1 Tax=Micrococcus sp. IITD107 TaxID=3342790 RepID=UPI0035B7E887
MSTLRTRTAQRDYRSVVVSSDEVRNHDRVVLIEKVPQGVEDRIVLELNVLRGVVGFDEVNLSTTVHYEECTLDRITRQLDAYKRRLSREHAVSEKPANRDEDGVSAVPREVERRTIDDHLRHDASPSVGADPAVEETGLAVVEPTDGDDSAVDGPFPSRAARAEGVGAAGASAAPTPDSNTFFECPSCGWATGVAGASLDYYEDRKLLEQWEEDVQLHTADCAERLHPRDEGTVALPMAVFKKLNPHTGIPGTILRCPLCRTSYWFERTKHGRKMLVEAIADHMDHTRVAR